MGTGDDVTPWSWREHGMEGATARAPTRSAALAVVRVLQWVRLLVVAAACLTLPAELIADAGPARAHLDILVLHSYHQGLPWTDSEQEGLQIGLGEHRSHFGVFVIDGVTVEVMGDVQKLIDSHWEDPVAVAPERRWVTLADAQVPVLSLVYEERAYRALGRLERAELLSRWLDDNPGMVL